MGTVRKRGKNYIIDYQYNGKRYRETIGPSKKLAELALKKREVEIAECRFLDKKELSRVIFDDFVEKYIRKHVIPNTRAKVAERYRGLIKNLLKSFSGKYLSDITPSMVEEYRDTRKTQIVPYKNKLVAPATVNRELGCLRNMYNKAILWKDTLENPVSGIKFLPENNRRQRCLEKDEIKQLIDVCAPHLKPIVILAVYTGMRRGEILSLKWSQVDFKNHIITLTHTKNGEMRYVDFCQFVEEALLNINKYPSSDYIFCNKDGKPYGSVKKSFATALRACGIINFTFHGLRHVHISHMRMSGADTRTVQELVGHKTASMTEHYTHILPKHKKDAVERFQQYMVTE